MLKGNIKILVGYHKPSYLFKDDVFVPIHLGRSLKSEMTKDNVASKEDLQWLQDNMIGDDTGDNISHLNRKFCELTGMYWAWKNYDKIGNPDYIGFMHYRRSFVLNENINNFMEYGCYKFDMISLDAIKNIGLDESNIAQMMEQCDVLAFRPVDISENFAHIKTYNPIEVYSSFDMLDVNDLDEAVQILKQKYPSFSDAADQYLSNIKMYSYNIFIMKKEIFMEYASWLFDILQETEKHIDYSIKSIDGSRAIGNIAEQLYGIYIYKLIKDNKYKIRHKPLSIFSDTDIHKPIEPVFDNDCVPVIFSADNKYLPYLATTIQSLIVNSSNQHNYDIIVLQTDIDKERKKMVIDLAKMYKNISIRFVNIDYILNQYDTNIFYTFEHFSKATYYRFFIPQICQNYSKILYLDCDIVILDDIANLYKINIGDNLLGATKEYFFQSEYIRNISIKHYMNNVLCLNDFRSYFNAGVLICNVKKMNEFNFTSDCIKRLQEIKKPFAVDQDILNSICQNRIFYFGASWNYCWHVYFKFFNQIRQLISVTDFNIWFKAREDAKIIHYTSGQKPWNCPEIPLAEKWWYYARMTPFYEEIIFANTKGQEKSGKKKSLLKLLKYKLLSKITFGNKKKKYLKKLANME